jgi:hypothetical protein
MEGRIDSLRLSRIYSPATNRLPEPRSECADQKQTKNIKNPLIDGPGMSDPHVLVENDICYIFSGHNEGFGNSEWVMPDWRIHRSTDLRSWYPMTRTG